MIYICAEHIADNTQSGFSAARQREGRILMELRKNDREILCVSARIKETGTEMIKRKTMRRIAAAATALSVAFSCGICVSAQETAAPSYLHSAYKAADRDGIGSGHYLYHVLKVTGEALGEEQIFTVKDMEELYIESISQSSVLKMGQTAEVNINGNRKTVNGIDLYKFIKLCGVTDDTSCCTQIQFFGGDAGSSQALCTKKLSEVSNSENKMIIALSAGGKALDDAAGGPLMLCDGKTGSVLVKDLSGIRIGGAAGAADPYYGLHSRKPLDYMQDDCVFTVNYIDKAKYPKRDDNAVPFATKKYSMGEIEALIRQNTDKTHGNYFGISGNEKSKDVYGLGGFSDYFEGIDMGWFLSSQAGLKDTEGTAEFYGRDNDWFSEIKDLSYFFAKDYSKYYLEIDDDTYIDNVVPVLAVSKNGAPLLPLHDHEMEGNIDYNTFNKNVNAAGYATKDIGLVKNVSGPFVAGLADVDGVYGGYRQETSGDCVRIDIYVNKADYAGITSKEAVSVKTGGDAKTLTPAQTALVKCAAYTASLMMFR